MSYRLRPGEPVEHEVRRIAVEQIDRALADLDACDLHDAVHQLRKRCKKLRGLLRLVRPALAGERYARENAAIRDAQRELSDLRDARVRLETLDALLDAFVGEVDPAPFAVVRDALRERCERSVAAASGGAAELDARLTRCRDALSLVRDRVSDWRLEGEGFEAVRGGVGKPYRRARRALERVREDPSAAAFHEWRKRAKYHLYHVRLLRPCWHEALGARRDAVDRLADRLGDAHDLAVLLDHLRDDPVEAVDASTLQALEGLAATRRAALRGDALGVGRRLFAVKPGAFLDGLGTWFEVAWEDDPVGPRALGDLAPRPGVH